MTLPRILYAVPHTLQVRMEIVKAIRALAAQDEAERLQKRIKVEAASSVREIIREIVGELCRELRKAAFNPDEPRVPAGNPDGGQWTKDGGSSDSTTAAGSGDMLSDATPDNNWIPGAQYAANDRPDIGHNQRPPPAPPKIPPQEPSTARAIYAFLRAAAYWVAEAVLAGEPVGDFLLALQAADWLSHYLPYIDAYLDAPKTLAELQRDASSPEVGYNIHHIVEQTSAAQDGFPQSMIDAPENLVRIPTFEHWQINAWYSTPNKEFGGLSPRDYLRGKSWDERWRVGIDALRRFGVLAP